jgi:hypothetical protein
VETGPSFPSLRLAWTAALEAGPWKRDEKGIHGISHISFEFYIVL